ncbi:hypothetical protein DUG79_19280 [Vibrio parahaemolyticus]|nr:hypothetical protein [Vibrio parahaemolyticus]
MKKKYEAVGKYLADLLRTAGLALVLFSGLGLALKRAEAIDHLPITIAFGVVGAAMIVLGSVIVLISTVDE